MSRDSLLLALCCSLGVACTQPAESPKTAAKAEPGAAAEAEVKAEAEAEAEAKADTEAEAETDTEAEADTGGETDAEAPGVPRFWVVNGGLHAYDLDGKALGISLGDRGGRALRLADGRVVVVDESKGTRVIVLDAQGEPGLELALPTVFDEGSCKLRMAKGPKDGGEDGGEDEHDDYGELSMQSDRDFSLNAAGTHACVTLLDRNENMADYSIDLAVDLATGKVETAVGYTASDVCPKRSLAACKDLASVEPWAEDAPVIAAKTWPYAYDDETGVLSRAGEPVRELCLPKDLRDDDFNPDYGGCVFTEETSDSGRWLLVGAINDEGGDYIYRSLYLLDLETGKLSTIECEDERRCAMVAFAPDQLFAGEAAGSYDVVGETEVGSLPGDRFWIEGMLLIPETGKLVSIGGTRVLTMTK